MPFDAIQDIADVMGLEQHRSDAIKKRLKRLVTAYAQADSVAARRAAE